MTPARTAAVAALVLGAAALSLLAGHSLRFDPLGWLRWGRELTLHHGALDTGDYPSWKPLPVLVTAPLALTGPLAPTLFLLVLRAAGFLSLVMVFGAASRRHGRTAGIVAVTALALVPEWWPTLLGGGIEPTLVALGCVAVACHQAGRRAATLLLLALIALGREEALLLVLVYGAFQVRRHWAWGAATAVAAGVVSLLWLGGDWLGSGDVFHAGELARNAHDAGAPALTTIRTVTGLLIAPVWIAVAVGAAVAVRTRDQLVMTLTAAAVLWTAVDVSLAFAGYPLPDRCLFPAAAMFCFVAALGTAHIIDRVLDPPRHDDDEMFPRYAPVTRRPAEPLPTPGPVSRARQLSARHASGERSRGPRARG